MLGKLVFPCELDGGGPVLSADLGNDLSIRRGEVGMVLYRPRKCFSSCLVEAVSYHLTPVLGTWFLSAFGIGFLSSRDLGLSG